MRTCGWGHLEFLVTRRRSFSDYLKWAPLLSSGRRIRNLLAHGKPIEYHDFLKMEGEARKAGFGRALL